MSSLCHYTVTAHKPVAFNAHCDLPDGHAGNHLPVIEFKSGCEKCKWEPHDFHQREVLLPPGYFECADCTAITEYVDPYKQLSEIKFRRSLCTDCFNLATDLRKQETRAKVGQVTPAEATTMILTDAIVPGDFDNQMSGASGYARQGVTHTAVVADDFGRAIHGDLSDGGGVWMSMGTPEPPGKATYANHIPGFRDLPRPPKVGDIIHFSWTDDEGKEPT